MPARALILTLTTLVAALPFPLAARADDKDAPKPDAKLAELLEPVRDKHKVPAVFGALVEGDRLVAVAAVGVRKVGADDPVTINDRVHIGSNTKAMTATVIAALVEKKKLRWDSTIGEVLPDLKGKIHDDYLGVTVVQLLAHEGGVVPNVIWLAPGGKTPREQRAVLLPVILKNEPANKPGTKFVYSNASYVVAAAMAEAAADESWEELVRALVFKPLDMKTAGFGPPGEKGKVDQPWGHKLADGAAKPSQTDNPPLLGPAGTVHASLPDWAKFAALHLQAARGKPRLLAADAFARLHTPAEGFNYSGGWLVGKDGSLAHDGSNTFWYARVRILPKENLAVLVAVNVGIEGGREAVEEAEKVLIAYFRDTIRKK